MSLDYKDKTIDWKGKPAATAVNYELIIAAILIAAGALIILWATFWMLITRDIQDMYRFALDYKERNGLDIVPFIAYPKSIILTWLSGTTSIFIGIIIARKELGPDKQEEEINEKVPKLRISRS